MSQHYLMRHPVVGEMYVPPEKREEYELRGYKIIEAPVNTGMQPGPSAAEDVEAIPATPVEPVKSSRKSSK